MAGFISDYWANKLLDLELGAQALTAPVTVYIALFLVAPTGVGGGTEASLGARVRAFGAGMLGALGAPPAYVGPATQTTAERIESMRAHARGAAEGAAAAAGECRGAWEAHERARRDFSMQITASASVFAALEQRRVGEISDSLRRYTIFVSSTLANLQYDVNRLATRFEEAGNLAQAVAAASAAEDARAGGRGGAAGAPSRPRS